MIKLFIDFHCQRYSKSISPTQFICGISGSTCTTSQKRPFSDGNLNMWQIFLLPLQNGCMYHVSLQVKKCLKHTELNYVLRGDLVFSANQFLFCVVFVNQLIKWKNFVMSKWPLKLYVVEGFWRQKKSRNSQAKQVKFNLRCKRMISDEETIGIYSEWL